MVECKMSTPPRSPSDPGHGYGNHLFSVTKVIQSRLSARPLYHCKGVPLAIKQTARTKNTFPQPCTWQTKSAVGTLTTPQLKNTMPLAFHERSCMLGMLLRLRLPPSLSLSLSISSPLPLSLFPLSLSLSLFLPLSLAFEGTRFRGSLKETNQEHEIRWGSWCVQFHAKRP